MTSTMIASALSASPRATREGAAGRAREGPSGRPSGGGGGALGGLGGLVVATAGSLFVASRLTNWLSVWMNGRAHVSFRAGS